MARPRVTLRDVARRVGAHPSTVSRALNPGTRGLITDDIARRVTRAAAALGYRLNPIAYGLKTNRWRTVGVIVPDTTHRVPAHHPRHRGRAGRGRLHGHPGQHGQRRDASSSRTCSRAGWTASSSPPRGAAIRWSSGASPKTCLPCSSTAPWTAGPFPRRQRRCVRHPAGRPAPRLLRARAHRAPLRARDPLHRQRTPPGLPGRREGGRPPQRSAPGGDLRRVQRERRESARSSCGAATATSLPWSRETTSWRSAATTRPASSACASPETSR